MKWKELGKSRPALPLAHNNLGLVLGEQGNLEEAIEELRTAIRLDPDFDEAQKALDRAKELDQD